MSAVDSVDGPVDRCDPAPGGHFEVGDTGLMLGLDDASNDAQKLIVRVNWLIAERRDKGDAD
jgi:hypothetical protein